MHVHMRTTSYAIPTHHSNCGGHWQRKRDGLCLHWQNGVASMSPVEMASSQLTRRKLHHDWQLVFDTLHNHCSQFPRILVCLDLSEKKKKKSGWSGAERRKNSSSPTRARSWGNAKVNSGRALLWFALIPPLMKEMRKPARSLQCHFSDCHHW